MNPPALPQERGRTWRLDQLMLAGNVVLVVSVVALSGVLQTLSIRRGFDQSEAVQRQLLEDQARYIEKSTARLLSITSATALRDNDFAFLSNLVGPVVEHDPNIVRVRIVDSEGKALADTAKEKDAAAATGGDQQFKETTFQGTPVLEHQHAIEREGQKVGAVIVDYSLMPLRTEIGRLESAKQQAIRRITIRMVGLALVLILAGILFGTWQSRRVTQPLAALTVESLRLAKGQMEARVEQSRSAGQELLTLGTVFNYMADQIRALLERARHTADLDQQMQIARAVQESFLPSGEIVAIEKVRFCGVVAPAEHSGGDFWAYRQLDTPRLVLCMGDVAGQGVATALVAAATCSSFFAGTDSVGHLDASTLLGHINRNLFQVSSGAHQVSCAVAILDLKTGQQEIANAGHPFPIVYNRRSMRVSQIVCEGPPLGGDLNARFSSVSHRLEPGDLVVWYSDGVHEAQDETHATYGLQRLRAVLESHGHLPVDQVRDKLIEDATRFAGGRRMDDMTLIVAEFQADQRAA